MLGYSLIVGFLSLVRLMLSALCTICMAIREGVPLTMGKHITTLFSCSILLVNLRRFSRHGT